MSEIEGQLEPELEVNEADQMEQAVPVPLEDEDVSLPLDEEPYDLPDPDND
jgi:hypothetical protein